MPSDPFMLQEKTTPTTSETILGGSTINPDLLCTFVSGGGTSLLPDGNINGQLKTIVKTSNMCSFLNKDSMLNGTVNDAYQAGDFVYVGGSFSYLSQYFFLATPSALALTAGIARYQISTGNWFSMGQGLSAGGVCYKITPDPTGQYLYILGTFTGDSSGAVVSSGIMKYNISTTALSTTNGVGLSAGATAYSIFFNSNTTYFLGGSFSSYGGTACVNCCYYNGSATVVQTAVGIQNTVFEIIPWNNDIASDVLVYVGAFQSANAVLAAQRMATWTISTGVWAATFTPLGASIAADVKSIIGVYVGASIIPTSFYLCGAFTTIAGVQCAKVAQYTVSTGLFTPLGGYGSTIGTTEQISKLASGQYMITGSSTPFNVGSNLAGQVSPSQNIYLFGLLDTVSDRWYSGGQSTLTLSTANGRRRSNQAADGSFYYCSSGAPYIQKIQPGEMLNIKTSGTRLASKFLINPANAFSNSQVSIRNPPTIFMSDEGNTVVLQWNSILSKWIVINMVVPVPTGQFNYNLNY